MKIEEAKKIGDRLKFDPFVNFSSQLNHAIQGKHYSAKLASKNATQLVAMIKLKLKVKEELTTVLQQFKSDEINKNQAAVRMKDILKSGHEEAFLRGMKAAGFDSDKLPDKEAKWLQSTRADEHMYLNKFLDDVENDRGTVDHYTRSSFYGDALNGTYNAGRNAAMPPGMLVYWRLESKKSSVTGKKIQHCETCLYLSKESPFTPATLPIVPRAGHTKCVNNCRCKLVYVTSTPERAEEVAKKKGSPRQVLAKMKKLGLVK